MSYMKDLDIQQHNQRKERLERMAEEGRLLEYFNETYKHREREIACMLMQGFMGCDHDNLKAYLDAEDGQQTKAEDELDENRWMDGQRL